MTRKVCWFGSARAWVAAYLAAAFLSLTPSTPVMAAAAAAPATPPAATTAAADAKKAETEEVDELEEVKVTGTRIQTPGATSTNPIDSITSEQMRNLGIVNVADALLQLVPQNISTYQPGLVGDIQTSGAGELGNIGIGFGNGTQGNNDVDRSSFFIGNTIANLRGLDPMFGTRTLTMVDGRRMVSSSSQADVVDMNIIPSNLLQRMDVVTGGASATYGSGAMAGVVNLVLNNRLTGFNLDMDYGINEAGDGSSPHISASGGMPLFSGRGHALIGVEWQNSSAIPDCAAARDWCRDSRTMFTNSTSSLIESNYGSPVTVIPGFEGYPARFQMANVRFSQFSPNGVIYENNSSIDLARPPPTMGLRLTADGQGIEEFPYGFRGSSNQSSVMNGDGPLSTSGSSMRSSSERKVMFSNFEFNITERTTAYLQTNYSKTHGYNRNRYTTSTACVRFNTKGVAGVSGGTGKAGQILYFGSGTIAGDQFVLPISPYNQLATPGMVRDPLWNNANFRLFLSQGGATVPNPISAGITLRPPTPQPNPTTNPFMGFTNRSASTSIATDPNARNVPDPANPPPTFNWGPNVVPGSAKYIFVKSPNSETRYWLLTEIVLAADFDDPGTPALLPTVGNNSYAFLNQLDPEALNAIQSAFNRSPSTGGANSATAALWGTNPCTGFTAIKKVWNPQIQQYTTNDTETWRAVAGIKGRFGRDWRWDGYYQFGETNTHAKTFNGATNLSFNFAMDAVIDTRATVIDQRETVNGQANPTYGQTIANSTYGQPVCRITRDGVPQLDTNGLIISDTTGLQALAAGCRPLNIFGDFSMAPSPWTGLDMTSEELAQMQRDALDYAYKDSASDGNTTLQTLSFNTNGTLWQGWGAGPMTAAFGFELSQNTVDNFGTRGSLYLRSDLSNWQDSLGGKTRSTEGFTEISMPLVSGVPGVNLWSFNGSARYTSYYNKGGEGMAVDANGKHLSATQGTFNWKIGTIFEPFDFIRFRLTRSRDMRSATYRDLFLNQATLPDQASGRNWWRERTEVTDENQNERFGYVRVGNPNLTPESSNTLTAGIVLSPGGWAQGMRLTADYSNIQVKNGIYTPYEFQSANTIIESCWRQSGNSDIEGEPGFGLNNLPDMDLATCREITFHKNPDGSIDPTDVIYVNSSRPANGLTYQQRNIDLSWQYMFPLSRAFESLPGNLSLNIRASRALEASGVQQGVSQRVTASGELNCNATLNNDNIFVCQEQQRRINLVGQIRSSQSVPGVSPRPKWMGNFSATYSVGDLTSTLSARYIGGAHQDNTWCDAGQQAEGFCNTYMDSQGRYLGGSVDTNWVKPYFNFSLNGSYNLKVDAMKQFQVFGSINNLFDKDPPFTGGGTLSGASAGYHDTMGRAYRMGVRLKF